MKKWNICRPDENTAKKLLLHSDLSPLCADVLVSRGICDLEAASEFIRTDGLEDPFVLKDMDKAVAIINDAAENGKRICIYGDYDCDGITSTVILYSYLECLGADVSYYIPERSEGYGLNEEAVRKIYNDNTDLIITVDNGISAIKEAELIKELGMQLIITDHHQPGNELPAADAIVNPHQTDCESSYKDICGAGVALKVTAALDGGDYEMALEQFGDIAAIATIADVVPLTGENRYIVQMGMQYIKNTERCGLIELMKISGLVDENGVCGNISSVSTAFMIAPRINAAGRFGSPLRAFELLMCDDPDEAAALAEELNSLNSQRKETESEIMQQIYDEINSRPDVLSQRVLVFSGDGWHHGVIGIVAAKIQEKYGKPCFIITQEGEISRGSARAFGDFSVFGCLSFCQSVLTKFGGHQSAGGFSLKTEDISRFNDLVEEYAAANFEKMPVFTINADKMIVPSDITIANAEGLQILEPFGEANKQPVFAVIGAVIEEIIPLSNGAHTKLKINYGGISFFALMFRTRTDELPFTRNGTWDFMVSLDINEYNGRKSVNLSVRDYRKSGINQESFLSAGFAYEKYIRNEELPEIYYKRMCPDRNELIKVYSAISEKPIALMTLFIKMNPKLMNYCKLRICLDIFRELKLIRYDYSVSEVSRAKVNEKANLENSKILRGLRDKWGTKAVQ